MGEVEKRATATGLEALAGRINEKHRAFVGSLKKTAEIGIEAGELLTEAKDQVKHGDWGRWLKENFEGSERSAQVYMQLYRNRDQIRSKSAESADLSIAGALKELSAPKPDQIHTHELDSPSGRRTVVTVETTLPEREPVEPIALEELDEDDQRIYEPSFRQQEEKHGTEAAQAWLGRRMQFREESAKYRLNREYEDFQSKGKAEYIADQLYRVVRGTTARFEDIPEKNPLPSVLDSFEWRRVLALIEHKRDNAAAAQVGAYANGNGSIGGAKQMRKDLGYLLKYHKWVDVKRLPEDIELLRKVGRNFAALADALETGMGERAENE